MKNPIDFPDESIGFFYALTPCINLLVKAWISCVEIFAVKSVGNKPQPLAYTPIL